MKKILVANRSEIAIRVFRAATELGLRTVAIYSHEDRFSLHRFKADESYQVGQGKGPVAAYLDIPDIIRIAVKTDCDAIHPGYGFLSENAEFAAACRDAGIAFVGPTPEMLGSFGDKLAAKQLAIKAGVPTVPGTEEPVKPGKELTKIAKEIGYPLMLKASFGGGGRGMRVVTNPEELDAKLDEAAREAGGAFGNAAVFVERYIANAKHIEVQVIGDTHGNVVHLWERDCSVQRRHQKVVEIAPAPNIDQTIRKNLCEAAVRLVKQINYTNAGTVEFLLDSDTGEYFFIEVNPRIQVEHTVTEMVTGIDLVRTQILIAQGEKLHDHKIGLPQQDQIKTSGFALQCRVTTEDPENRFIPDYGKITNYRSPAGFGIRLDGGTAYSGAAISPYYDSMLVKLTAWAGTFEQVITRMDRALREFRIRGVKTNIPFLDQLVLHPTFKQGGVTTTFIDNTPELFRWTPRRDRATKLLNFLSDITVNGNSIVKGRTDGRDLPEPQAPAYDDTKAPPAGLRDKFKKIGAVEFSKWIRKQKALLLTDTTFRDAHQSLLATRMRTFDMLAVAPYVARNLPQLFSMEMWGGATFDASMRFLNEDPWDRLDKLRAATPNILFQMLLRAGNAVGYTNYPDDVVQAFVKTSAEHGIDVFRIFDALNWLPNMQPAMEAVQNAGAICEASICYTGDILDPKRDKYSLKYYVTMAKELEKMGAHILCIKDMAGLCKPYAAYKLVKALRDEIGLPVHFHTHDTAGSQLGSIIKAAEAGVDIADSAAASMSGLTSQPNLNSLVQALEHTPRHTGMNLDALSQYAAYWGDVRKVYYPFESGMVAGTAEVYSHEMPGGQVTNLQEQAKSLGLGARWHEVAKTYADVNQLFGDIIKVTPTSKVVGDMALFLVTNNLKAEDALDETRDLSFPASVVEFFEGRLGQPYGGFPEKLQKIILRGKKPLTKRPGEILPATDFAKIRKELEGKIRRAPSETDLMSYLMYPKVFVDFETHRKAYSDTSIVPTEPFFFGLKIAKEMNIELEPGKTLIIKLIAIAEPDDEGMRTLYYELHGQPRSARVPDSSMTASRPVHAKADLDNPCHVAAPMPGKVGSVTVKVGQKVHKGDKLLSIEAMKMETAVYAPLSGKVTDVKVSTGSTIESKDLLVVMEPGDAEGSGASSSKKKSDKPTKKTSKKTSKS